MGAKKTKFIAKQNWGKGLVKALLWKELIGWERTKFKATVYSVAFWGLLSLLLAYLCVSFEVSIYFFLLFPLFFNWGGSTFFLDFKKPIIQLLQGSSSQKLFGLSIINFLENVVLTVILGAIFGVSLLYWQGNIAVWELLIVLILAIFLNLNLLYCFIGMKLVLRNYWGGLRNSIKLVLALTQMAIISLTSYLLSFFIALFLSCCLICLWFIFSSKLLQQKKVVESL